MDTLELLMLSSGAILEKSEKATRQQKLYGSVSTDHYYLAVQTHISTHTYQIQGLSSLFDGPAATSFSCTPKNI